MNRKPERATCVALVIAVVFESLALWLQFDREVFGRGGGGFDFIRNTFEMSPADVVVRFQAGFALAVIFTLGFLLDSKDSEKE